jgi:hypothetical protein
VAHTGRYLMVPFSIKSEFLLLGIISNSIIHSCTHLLLVLWEDLQSTLVQDTILFFFSLSNTQESRVLLY